MTSLSLSPSLSLAKTSHLILSTPLFCNSIYTGCVASASPPPFPPHCSQRDQNTHRSTFLSALNTAGILSTLTVRAKVFPVVCALLPLPASSSPHPFAHSLVFPWSNQAVLPSRLFLCLRVSMSFSLTHIHLWMSHHQQGLPRLSYIKQLLTSPFILAIHHTLYLFPGSVCSSNLPPVLQVYFY
jgi:hypothetical protein